MSKMTHLWVTCMSLRKSVVLLRSCASLPLALAHPCANQYCEWVCGVEYAAQLRPEALYDHLADPSSPFGVNGGSGMKSVLRHRIHVFCKAQAHKNDIRLVV